MAESTRPRWEYKVIADPREGDLTSLGDDGWELVQVTQGPGTRPNVAYLKRRKDEP